METRRFILYAVLAFILYSIWTKWQTDYPHPVSTTMNNTSGTLITSGDALSNPPTESNALLPSVSEPGSTEDTSSQNNETDSQAQPNMSNQALSSLIQIKTDRLLLNVDTQYGDIVKAELIDYPTSNEAKDQPFVLLSADKGHEYTANSSLLEKGTNGVQSVQFNFHADNRVYQFYDNQDQLNVVLSGSTDNGIDVTKTFIFKKDSYLVDIRYDINNQGNEPWVTYLNTQLLRSSPDEDKSSMFHIGSYTGASYSNPAAQRYKKVSFSDMGKGNLNVSVNGGWIAMQQHYFLTAWIPAEKNKNTFYTRSVDDHYTIGAVSQPLVVKPGERQTITAQLYLGPEITSTLKGIAPGLDLTIDYGWLWFLSSFIFALMKAIDGVIGNWGWSIVLVTVLVKLVFYRLSASSYRSMAGMRQLQPKLQALRDRCGEDKAKLSQATMELYRQEKINPLGGCLPIVVQIPVFIALYWVLLESVELRQAPFVLWIQDLSAADPFHVLPIIMGATMLIQQRLNPAPPDPMQAKIMMFLPILFTGLFWNFPAGLVLYWIVNNSLSILQQWHITQKYSSDKPTTKKTHQLLKGNVKK